MPDFDHKDEEQISRKQAAERLTDIAYALTAGVPVELRVEGRPVRIPVADVLFMKRESRLEGGMIELDLRLSWSSGG